MNGVRSVSPLRSTLLTALKPNGLVDPGFNGGAPIVIPGDLPSAMLPFPDGSLVIGDNHWLARFTAAGRPDPTFGDHGVAVITALDRGLPVGVELLPAADGGLLAIQANPGPQGLERNTLSVLRIAANGTFDASLGGPTGIDYQLPFGGGEANGRPRLRPEKLASLTQDSFNFDPSFRQDIVERPDGSYLAVGGVSVVQRSNFATGVQTVYFGAAALTPTFTLDTSFGGPATAVRARLHVVHQNASVDHARNAIRVNLDASAPGLALVQITAAGRMIAQSVQPLFSSGANVLEVQLTRYGRALLRGHRNLRVRAGSSHRNSRRSSVRHAALGLGRLRGGPPAPWRRMQPNNRGRTRRCSR